MTEDAQFTTIDSLLALHAKHLQNYSPGSQNLSLWRGQSVDHPLLSSAYRGLAWSHSNNKRRSDLVHDFAEQNAAYLTSVSLRPEWEAAAIAQHVGVPTKLLDWSLSPRIAIWFAVQSSDKDDHDGVVWWARSTNPVLRLEENSISFPESPYHLGQKGHEEYEVYESRSRHPRITAQFARFVAWGRPETPFDAFMKSYEGGEGKAPKLVLTKFRIPSPNKIQLRAMLRADGLDERVLLADPDGLDAWVKTWMQSQSP
jgi:hypothetical protein